MASATLLPAIADRFKRSIISETALRLNAAHGRRKMYSADEVRAAMATAHFPAAWAGWAIAVFCTDAEFADYCRQQGLDADYAATRAEALRFIDRPMAPAAGAPGTTAGTRPSSGEALGDAVDLAGDGVDAVGGLFDALGIFD